MDDNTVITSHIVHFVWLFVYFISELKEGVYEGQVFWCVSPGNQASNIITIILIGKAVSKQFYLYK